MKQRNSWLAVRGLRTQLLLWAILPLTLVLIAVAFTGIYGHERSMRHLVAERDQLVAQIYARQVSDMLANSKEMPPWETWQALFDDVRVGANGVVYLVDGEGQVVYHPQHALCGTDYSNHSGMPTVFSSSAGSTPCQSPDGVQMYLSYAEVKGTDWRVVVEEPLQDVMDPLLRLSSLLPFVIGLAAVVAILALVFGARTLVWPLQRLARAADRVGWGDLSAIAEPVGGVEEIESLHQALQDMTGRIQSYQEGMRDYLAAVTDAQEGERARLARELHDETVQELVALGQRLEMARKALARGEKDRAQEVLDEARRMATTTMEGVRRFSRDLRPLYLEDLGFVPAVQMLGKEAGQASGIPVDVRVEGEPERLTSSQELSLYRIAQEALRNAVQHAHAKHIWLTLRFNEGISLSVSDDGVGFRLPERPDELTHEGHFGLLGMRERAQLAGGNLHISSQSGEGTTVTVMIPETPEADSDRGPVIPDLEQAAEAL